jgi:hypothetical protein
LLKDNTSKKILKDGGWKDRAHVSVLFAVSIILLAITLVLLGWFFFWYRVQRGEAPSSKGLLEGNTREQALLLSAALAIDESEYTSDRIAARIIDDHVASASSYSAGVSASREKILRQLKKGEMLWQDPVTPPQKNFPMVLSWLAYSSADADRLFRSELEKINSNAGAYELLDIIPVAVVPSENEKIMRMQASVIFRNL